MLDDATSITSANSFARDGLRELDRYYTPEKLADRLVSLATIPVDTVADFAAGTGNLLVAALKKWPGASAYANDVDGSALRHATTRLRLSGWDQLDFLSEDFHGRVATRMSWSLILLNPPFSQREIPLHVPVGQHSGIRCSRAMAFVMSALQYLAPGGQLLAILPASTLTNRIDGAARDVLRSRFLTEIVLPPTYGLFSGADVSTYILRISDRSQPLAIRGSEQRSSEHWSILRGNISVARAAREVSSGDGWVHTTSLNDGRIAHRYEFPAKKFGRVAPLGSVLLPRVGRFGPSKIAIVERAEERISDCILAIGHSELPAEEIVGLLRRNFDGLVSLYGGTGAPYITRERLQEFLDALRSSGIEHGRSEG